MIFFILEQHFDRLAKDGIPLEYDTEVTTIMWYALGIIVITRDCHQDANGTLCTYRWVLCDIICGYSYLPIERRIRNGHETVFDVSAYVCIITQSPRVSLLMVLIKAVMATVLMIYTLHKYIHSIGIFKDINHDGTTLTRNAEWSDMSSCAMGRWNNAWYHQA